MLIFLIHFSYTEDGGRGEGLNHIKKATQFHSLPKEPRKSWVLTTGMLICVKAISSHVSITVRHINSYH